MAWNLWLREPPPPPRQPLPEGLLRVRVASADGRPLSGRAAFHRVARGAEMRSALHLRGGLEGLPDPTEVAFEGAIQHSVREGSWTWGRIVAPDRGTALLRVPPFRGSHDTEVVFVAGHSTLHLLVYDTDWRTPAARARVQITHTDPQTGAQRDLGRLEADADGYLAVSGAVPGAYVARVEGFRPGDGRPHVVSLDVPKGPRSDPVAFLALPGPRHEVTIEALVQELAPGSAAPRLLLRRTDPVRGELFAQRNALHSGSQALSFLLPPGAYQPLTLPIGAMTVRGEDDLLRVPAEGGAPFRLHLGPAAGSAHVVMSGIAAEDLPMRVYPQPADGIREDDPEALFLGPLPWTGTEADVPCLPEPTLLVAIGRKGNYLAAAPATFASGRVEVAMRPACWLRLEWHQWDAKADADATVTVTADGVEWACPMRPRLGGDLGAMYPTMAADIVVPLGDVRVAYERRDGRMRWRKPVTADRARLTVMVP